MSPSTLAIWAIAALAAVGVVARPFRLPEALWAVAGAILLLALGLISWADAVGGAGRSLDVCLFLVGMMLLSETARREGVFDWVASLALSRARGSPTRLFRLVFGLGVVVTTFLSNDATAVVLTPAVYAVARRAGAEALPYLFICAFVANAASFVLPISNPANLVLYGDHTPPLGRWLASFAAPSVLSIIATYLVLRVVEGSKLRPPIADDIGRPTLTTGGRTALAGIGLTAFALVAVTAFDVPLGLPTSLLGVATTLVTIARDRRAAGAILRGVTWSILPLVAGLFVLVKAVDRTGLTALLAHALTAAGRASEAGAAAVAGGLVALASNLINNLPAGLIASTTIARAHPPRAVVDALLIGVDLGPNLCVTGSLATILWLAAIRREGESVGFWRFLKVGALVTPPALVLAIGARLLGGALFHAWSGL